MADFFEKKFNLPKFATGGIIPHGQKMLAVPEELIVPHEQMVRIFRLDNIVQVVRCKDCDSYCPETNHRPVCLSWGSWCDPDGWCYKGERKDNG